MTSVWMRKLTTRGRITIPKPIRDRWDVYEVDVIDHGSHLVIGPDLGRSDGDDAEPVS